MLSLRKAAGGGLNVDAAGQTSQACCDRGHGMSQMTSGMLKVSIALIVAALLVSVAYLLPIRSWLAGVIEWASSAGAAGILAVVVVYILGCLFFFPGSVITLGAGYAFGFWWGYLAVTLGSVLGATAAFLAGRTLLRGFVASRVEGNHRFAAIDQAVGERGFWVVMLTRLSPVFPFNLLNYAYGLTRVRTVDYVLGSWLGMIPGTLLYVYLGTALQKITAVTSGDAAPHPARTVLFVLGLFATAGVSVYVARIARRALRDATRDKLVTPSPPDSVEQPES